MFILGIDIGGTQVKGAVLTDEGTKVAQSSTPTEIKYGTEGILDSLWTVIDDLIKVKNVAVIGVGTAGRVNIHTGQVVFATGNLPGWSGTELKTMIQNRYGVPVAVDNDANTALIGELWKGMDETYPSAVMLTIGTGVGGANVINGNVIRGRNWKSGEWGHTIFVPNGLPCNCGQKGCVEQYLSGSALVRMAKENGLTTITHGKQVFEAYAAGNQAAKRIVDAHLDNLVSFLTTISNGLDPDVVILGGGVIESKDIFWSVLDKKLQSHQLTTEIRHAVLGNEAGIYGSVKLALDYLGEEGTR